MARSPLINPNNNIITDSGSILWSFIKGEQLEFPIELAFIEQVSAGFIFEAVVVEALNEEFSTKYPIMVKPDGINTTLSVRVPIDRGVWDAQTAYSENQMVTYNGAYYEYFGGNNIVSSITPESSNLWEITSASTIYVRFPMLLGSTWAQQPVVGFPTYGFFELRVTESAVNEFPKTWKPVRGMVQLLFSPTDAVPDV